MMDILSIPYARHTGIERSDSSELHLPFTEHVYNHLQTIHASAQFTLAETASGDYLLSAFPEWADKVLPVLRDAQIKFKRPAMTAVTATAFADEAAMEKFRIQLGKKGRASITINVDVTDSSGKLTCRGEFNWFVQRQD